MTHHACTPRHEDARRVSTTSFKRKHFGFMSSGNMKQPQNRHFVQMPLGQALQRTEYINSHMGPISANRDTYHRTNETHTCTVAQLVRTTVV
jgi:hypothetical protein